MGNIRTEMLKNSIAEYTDIANSIKENTSEIINSMLREAVADEYVKIMTEDFDKEDEDDTEVKETEDVVETSEEDNDIEAEDTETVTDDAETDEDVEGEESESSLEIDSDMETEEDESTPTGMGEFEAFKIEGADDQYDFSKADDETLVKVYKLLDNSDEVVVKMDKENNRLGLKTNDTEYIIELDPSCDEEECGVDDFTDNDINESRKMIEIVLTENNNLGYTTNYQDSDVMTTPSMKEPGRNVNDWDAGVPKGKQKPWPGSPKSKSAPYGKTVNEDEMEECGMEDMTEGQNVPTKEIPSWGTNGKGKPNSSDKFNDYGVNQKPKTKNIPSWGTELSEDMDLDECGEIEECNDSRVRERSTGHKSYVPKNKQLTYGAHHISSAGKYEGDYPQGRKGSANESMKRKHATIMKENKIMKEKLSELMNMVNEAAVTNLSLGHIVKLFNENATTQDEKKEIYSRFNDVHTIEESKKLYKAISQELSKKSTMNINEDKQYAAPSNQINENVIHMTKDLMNSLDLMHKICK